MKKVLLAKARGVKFKPNIKGWSKTGKKSIIGMDYQKSRIIADAVESGMRALTAWSLSIITGKSRIFHCYAFLKLEPVLLN